MADTVKDRWRLVRQTSIPRNLRHLLLILMHYQGGNNSVWCRRKLLADELDVHVDNVSQKLKQLEDIGVVKSVWINRNGKPSRQHSIQFKELEKHQRTLMESSDCTLMESSECTAPTLMESSDSVLWNHQTHSDGIIRHEQPDEQPDEQPSSRQNRFADSDMQTAEFFWKLIRDMQPNRKAPNLETWANTIRLLRERDGRTDDQIRDLFDCAIVTRFGEPMS